MTSSSKPHSFTDYRFLLGSKSPRRQHLLKELGLHYELVHIDVEETYPSQLQAKDIALYLCELKADAFDMQEYDEKTVLITADTIVWLNGEYIGKPSGKADAVKMLRKLSGKVHTVYSGICLRTPSRKHLFFVETEVSFTDLSDEAIHYYIEHHRPYDKAGSYGIQDWIGYTGVKGIKGCYYNVMGFPVQRFWDELNRFIDSTAFTGETGS